MNLIGNNIYEGFEPMPVSITGWNHEHFIFDELIEQLKPKTIIEMGTWRGGSAINMAVACKMLGLNTKIYCVDTWLGSLEFWTDLKDTQERDLLLKNGYPSIYYQFLSNVVHNDLQNIIIPVPNTSVIAASILQHYNIKAELIYIDASHEYEDVKADINAYLPLLNRGGVMFGDDYGWPTVKRAVHDQLISVEIIEGNFWVYRR